MKFISETNQFTKLILNHPILSCRCNCYAAFSEEERHHIFQSFCGLQDHVTQNTYLRGCIAEIPASNTYRGMKIKSLVSANDPALLRDAYPTFLSVKEAKLSDVNYLLAHVFFPEHVTFYSVLTSATKDADSDEEDVE